MGNATKPGNGEFENTAPIEQIAPNAIFFNEVPTLLAEVDTNLTYSNLNRAYAEFFGRTVEATVGLHVSQVLGASYGEARQHLESALSGVYERYQFLAPHNSGSDRWLDVRYLPKHNSKNEVVGVFVVVSDVDEIVRSRVVIEQRNKSLERMNQELIDFSYSLSHDLKAPLTSIAALLDVCREDLQDGHITELLPNIERAKNHAERLAGRIENVLTLAKSEITECAADELNIAERVDAICKLLGVDSHAELVTEFNHVEPFFSDHTRFTAIVQNLLSNSVKFVDNNKPQHRISIRTWGDEEWLHCSIEDNGIGIPEKYQSKVFEKFERMPNHSESGSGLGLAIVKRNIDFMEGEISFQSDSNTTRFEFRIPNLRARE